MQLHVSAKGRPSGRLFFATRGRKVTTGLSRSRLNMTYTFAFHVMTEGTAFPRPFFREEV